MIDKEILEQAFKFAESGDKGTVIGDNHITYVCCKGADENILMEEGMLGQWFVANGFTVKFEVRDVEYTTQSRVREGCRAYSLGGIINPHKAYLRNRTVMEISW